MVRAESGLPELKFRKVTIGLVIIAALHAALWGAAMLLFSSEYFEYSGLSPAYALPGDKAWGMFGLIGGLLFLAAVTIPTQMARTSFLFFFMNLGGAGVMSFWVINGPVHPLPGFVHLVGYLSGVFGFGMASWEGYSWNRDLQVAKSYFEGGSVGQILGSYLDQNGKNLRDLNEKSPVLLVFLRHFGCTFCREALDDLRTYRSEIEAGGVKVAVVHMVDDATAGDYIDKYPGLEGVSRFSDPEKKLYEAFELKRGNFNQLFGMKSWVEGFRAGILNGHLVGSQIGDGFQMPGMFLIQNGEILRGFRHQNASDRPDYCYGGDCAASRKTVSAANV
jgi:hypothetical protein